ncbi:CMRF35-like molecule 6 isoform X1 [Piliocolobus tephrosceles]|uniref:CMRF35-like molecule 6 isoform X1 n=1 Tax=Piliocolobus tephrosceles TaxID=591936 RepID=UPI000E6B1D94|nr:CMRF35-like molecule 6 isoform X1 [Piliocolobus tephrosceles]
MTARAWASWRPSALLLLLVPGCFPLRGPGTVYGPVGGSLSVQCSYEEEHKTLNKYWCRPPRLLRCDKIVETKEPAGKMNGRVSIRDSPKNLSFTVTLESLTEEDAGTYWCGVNTPWLQDLHDPYVQVEVSVFPGVRNEELPEGTGGRRKGPLSSCLHRGPPPRLHQVSPLQIFLPGHPLPLRGWSNGLVGPRCGCHLGLNGLRSHRSGRTLLTSCPHFQPLSHHCRAAVTLGHPSQNKHQPIPPGHPVLSWLGWNLEPRAFATDSSFLLVSRAALTSEMASWLRST